MIHRTVTLLNEDKKRRLVVKGATFNDTDEQKTFVAGVIDRCREIVGKDIFDRFTGSQPSKPPVKRQPQTITSSPVVKRPRNDSTGFRGGRGGGVGTRGGSHVSPARGGHSAPGLFPRPLGGPQAISQRFGTESMGFRGGSGAGMLGAGPQRRPMLRGGPQGRPMLGGEPQGRPMLGGEPQGRLMLGGGPQGHSLLGGGATRGRPMPRGGMGGGRPAPAAASSNALLDVIKQGLNSMTEKLQTVSSAMGNGGNQGYDDYSYDQGYTDQYQGGYDDGYY